MKLGDRIKLRIERKPLFDDKPDVTDGEFTIIGMTYGLPHCFCKDCWSQGFNNFEYGEYQDGKCDIVLKGKVYVPTPSMLDEYIMEDLHHDNKIVSWEVINPNGDK